jgi:DNA-binding CsgD family transcriptional regulator
VRRQVVQRSALAVVEAAYRLDLSTTDWLAGIVSAARAALDHGLGAACVLFRIAPEGTVSLASEPCGAGAVPDGYLDLVRSVPFALSAGDVEESWAHPMSLDTTSGVYRRIAPGARLADWSVYQPALAIGIHDDLAAKLLDPTGRGCILLGPSPREIATVDPGAEARWQQVMTHILAALRLREALPHEEAVIEPSGRITHAEGEARARTARESLREAALSIDRARTRSTDPELALRAWRGLVSGRWSLVDRFDRDGRRFLVARRNSPAVQAPRALSKRARQVLAYAALGYSNKHIAYALGLAPSTVSTHLRAGMRQLGLRDLAALAELLRRSRHDGDVVS